MGLQDDLQISSGSQTREIILFPRARKSLVKGGFFVIKKRKSDFPLDFRSEKAYLLSIYFCRRDDPLVLYNACPCALAATAVKFFFSKR